jgi:hypothetical protein
MNIQPNIIKQSGTHYIRHRRVYKFSIIRKIVKFIIIELRLLSNSRVFYGYEFEGATCFKFQFLQRRVGHCSPYSHRGCFTPLTISENLFKSDKSKVLFLSKEQIEWDLQLHTHLRAAGMQYYIHRFYVEENKTRGFSTKEQLFLFLCNS